MYNNIVMEDSQIKLGAAGGKQSESPLPRFLYYIHKCLWVNWSLLFFNFTIPKLLETDKPCYVSHLCMVVSIFLQTG